MSKETQSINGTDLRKYRTELPNLYDDAGLSVYEFRLLAHYVRVGVTWESTLTTAKKCGMSKPMVIKARRLLEQKGFIKIEEEIAQQGKVLIIHIVDLWPENYQRYQDKNRSHSSPSGHTVDQPGHAIDQPGHTVYLKKEPIKKEPIKNNDKLSVDNLPADEKPTSGATKYLLESLGAKRFKNSVQRETIERLEREHGEPALKELVDWAAKRGMAVSGAIIAIEGALKKRGQNGKTATIKVTPGQER